METELWTRWVGPSRIGYFVRRNACYLSLSCTEVSKTVEQLLGLFKWIDGALFDSFLKGKNHQLFQFQDSIATQICAELYTLCNSGPKFVLCFIFQMLCIEKSSPTFHPQVSFVHLFRCHFYMGCIYIPAKHFWHFYCVIVPVSSYFIFTHRLFPSPTKG